jgi:hypothetical protein
MRLRSLAPAVLTAAAVLVLPACGGDSEESASSGSSSSSSSSAAATTDSSAAEDTSAFCGEAQAALDANNEAILTAQEDPTQLSAAVQQATDQLSAITPPDEIATDWQTLVDTGQQLADLTAGVDITTPEGQAQIGSQLQEIGASADPASANVEAYLSETCGIAASPTS